MENGAVLPPLPRSPLPTELTLKRDHLVGLQPAACRDEVERLGNHLLVRAHRDVAERTRVAEVHTQGVTGDHTNEADDVSPWPVQMVAHENAAIVREFRRDLVGYEVGGKAAERYVLVGELPGGANDVAHLALPGELVELLAREHGRTLGGLAVPDLHARVAGGTGCLGQHLRKTW